MQLQSFSRTLLVVLTAPLGLIGVTLGLLLFGKPFGFVAMLGVVGLYLLCVALVFNVANAVFNTALYHYATTQQTPAGFSPEVLQSVFAQSRP